MKAPKPNLCSFSSISEYYYSDNSYIGCLQEEKWEMYHGVYILLINIDVNI